MICRGFATLKNRLGHSHSDFLHKIITECVNLLDADLDVGYILKAKLLRWGYQVGLWSVKVRLS